MAFTPDELKRRARLAYEIGRLRMAAPWAVLLAAIGLLGTIVTGAGGFGFAMTAVSCLTAVMFVWHGQSLGRGVWPGAWVGGAAMILAMIAWICEAHGSTSFVECRLPCIIAGVAIGAAAVSHARRGDDPRAGLTTLLATAAIATPLALIVCAGLGTGGMVGLAAGLAVGSAPAVARAITRPA